MLPWPLPYLASAFAFAFLALLHVDPCEIDLAICHVKMIETNHTWHLDIQRLLKLGLRVFMISLPAVDHAHTGMGRSHVRVLRDVCASRVPSSRNQHHLLLSSLLVVGTSSPQVPSFA